MVNQDEWGNLFGKWLIGENTWCITNRWRNFIYLLIGEEKALLIDSGTGEGNIRQFVETITDKPVMVVNTHGHFDHTGGNFRWSKSWMSQATEQDARNAFAHMPQEWFDEKEYPDYEIGYLEDNQVIDLGNRKVKVIAIGAHNPGSLAFLDEQTRALFTGDEIESGQVLIFQREQQKSLEELVTKHRNNMLKLKNLREEYDLIWPGHNGLPLIPDVYINDFIKLDEQILNGTVKIAENTGGLAFPTDVSKGPFESLAPMARAEYGLASIVYQK